MQPEDMAASSVGVQSLGEAFWKETNPNTCTGGFLKSEGRARSKGVGFPIVSGVARVRPQGGLAWASRTISFWRRWEEKQVPAG